MVEKIRLTALVFDLDGTLIDSRKDIHAGANAVRDHFGLDPLTLEQVESYIGNGLPTLIRRSLPDCSSDEVDRGIEVFRNHYRDHCTDHTELFPGVREMVDTFGDRPMAVVTNKPSSFARQILEKLELESRFAGVIGGDTPELLKPEPGPLLAAFEAMGIDPEGAGEVVMVGDSQPDIEVGKAVGTITCAVTYGMRGREDLADLDPDFIIDSMWEFSDLFH